MMARAVYIAIFIGFLRRLLRKTLAPSGKRLAATGEEREIGSTCKQALFLVTEFNYYIVPGTTHEMDDGTALRISREIREEWREYCRLVDDGLHISVLHCSVGPDSASIDRPLGELRGKLDSPARKRLDCLVNGARATYNDLWRRGV